MINARQIKGIPSGWCQIPAASFTATPASTSTITMGVDMTSSILIGMPLRYTISSVEYFGIVAAITSSLLTVNGAPLSGDVSNLQYGDPNKVSQIVVTIPSKYEDASNTDLIASDLKSSFIWDRAKSYLVKFGVYSDTADSSTNGQASVQINNTEVNTTTGGATIAAAKTWYNTIVNIATAAYDINPGEELEITCIAGTGKDASDLTAKMIFVTP